MEIGKVSAMLVRMGDAEYIALIGLFFGILWTIVTWNEDHLDIIHINELLSMTAEARKTYLDELRKNKRRYTAANKVWRSQYAEEAKKRWDQYFINFSAKSLHDGGVVDNDR